LADFTSRTATKHPVVDAADVESTGTGVGVATYAVHPTNAQRLWNL